MKWTFLVSGFDEDLPAGQQLNDDLRRYSAATGGPPALTMEVNEPAALRHSISYPRTTGSSQSNHAADC